jgi:hypothetical protein
MATNRLLKRIVGDRTRLDLLLALARLEARDRPGTRGYLEELENEIEAEPSPLTRAEELERLNLPSPI